MPTKRAPRTRTVDVTLTDVQKDLVLQALETELGGVQVYTSALECVQNDDLAREWKKYLRQTEKHVRIMLDVCDGLGLDSEEVTPGRGVVRHIGESLVSAMALALEAGDAAAAELVACECVTLAETKDHSNWELMHALAQDADGVLKKVLDKAVEQVEDEEDEHVYHSAGWCRELWKQGLGLDATLPPPEEEDDVHTMEEAARAKKKSERGGVKKAARGRQ